MSDHNFEPWAKYPPLTRERLCTIANVIRRVRHDAVSLHEPMAGDNGWSLGCRVYVRTCHALREAAKEHEWLKILQEEENLRFTFAIGSIPFKFYHGEAGDPPGRYLIATFAEIHQRQLALKLDGVPMLDQILRLAVETHATGDVSSVTLVEMDEHRNVTESYRIPYDAEPSKVVRMEPKAINLPPPKIEALESNEEKSKKEGKKHQGPHASSK
jgi:hypothetical protein